MKFNIKASVVGNGLIYPFIQKGQQRADLPYSLGIMNDVQASQLKYLQDLCGTNILSGNNIQNQYCVSTENFFSNVTFNLNIYNVANWVSTSDAVKQALTLYFDSSQTWYNQLASALHIDSYRKNSTSQWTTDPQVYEAFLKSNDIYGNDSFVFLNYCIQRTKVYIYEGPFDWKDGPLGAERWLKQLDM